VQTLKGNLIATATPENHQRIAELLARIRDAYAPRAAIEAARRKEARLQRVLDERLAVAALSAARVQTPVYKALLSGPVDVTILVNDVKDSKAIAEMTSLGLRIDDTNARMNVIAGRMTDATKLVDLALLPFVRRIEPLEGK
jgi:hypothetical protein